MSKQNLWFLTLFSLILVLSVYYITMPNDLLISNKKDEKVVSTKNEKTKIEETSSLVAMRVSLEEERQNEMDVLQELLTISSLLCMADSIVQWVATHSFSTDMTQKARCMSTGDGMATTTAITI